MTNGRDSQAVASSMEWLCSTMRADVIGGFYDLPLVRVLAIDDPHYVWDVFGVAGDSAWLLNPGPMRMDGAALDTTAWNSFVRALANRRIAIPDALPALVCALDRVSEGALYGVNCSTPGQVSVASDGAAWQAWHGPSDQGPAIFYRIAKDGTILAIGGRPPTP